jgi:hypothetical protein
MATQLTSVATTLPNSARAPFGFPRRVILFHSVPVPIDGVTAGRVAGKLRSHSLRPVNSQVETDCFDGALRERAAFQLRYARIKGWCEQARTEI